MDIQNTSAISQIIQRAGHNFSALCTDRTRSRTSTSRMRIMAASKRTPLPGYLSSRWIIGYYSFSPPPPPSLKFNMLLVEMAVFVASRGHTEVYKVDTHGHGVADMAASYSECLILTGMHSIPVIQK